MITIYPQPTITQVHAACREIVHEVFRKTPERIDRMEKILTVAAVRELCRRMTFDTIADKLGLDGFNMAHRQYAAWEKLPETERTSLMLAVATKLGAKV